MQNIFSDVIKEITPLLTNAITSIIGIFITLISYKVISILNLKKEQMSQNIDLESYDYILKIAESIYYYIEQNFKNQSSIIKMMEFDRKIKEKLPELSDEDINIIRESIVGKNNNK